MPGEKHLLRSGIELSEEELAGLRSLQDAGLFRWWQGCGQVASAVVELKASTGHLHTSFRKPNMPHLRGAQRHRGIVLVVQLHEVCIDAVCDLRHFDTIDP